MTKSLLELLTLGILKITYEDKNKNTGNFNPDDFFEWECKRCGGMTEYPNSVPVPFYRVCAYCMRKSERE